VNQSPVNGRLNADNSATLAALSVLKRSLSVHCCRRTCSHVFSSSHNKISILDIGYSKIHSRVCNSVGRIVLDRLAFSYVRFVRIAEVCFYLSTVGFSVKPPVVLLNRRSLLWIYFFNPYFAEQTLNPISSSNVSTGRKGRTTASPHISQEPTSSLQPHIIQTLRIPRPHLSLLWINQSKSQQTLLSI